MSFNRIFVNKVETLFILILLSVLFYCSKNEKLEWKWISLFNGKDLKNWELVGDWKVENENIIGVSNSNENSECYLTYKRNFRDFKLQIKYKIEGSKKGAVSFRTKNGIVEKSGDDGYKVNIDPNDKICPTGSICDIARAYEVSENSFKVEEWETLEIWAEGDHFFVIYNGQRAAEGFDRRSLYGKISINVRDDSKIIIEEIKIFKLPKKEIIEPPIKEYLDNAQGEWMAIFNGKDLEGWKLLEGKATFKLEDGCISAIPGAGGGWLFYTNEAFTDFIYRIKVKVKKGENSGIAYRYDPSYGMRLPSWFRSEVQVLGSNVPDVPDGTGAVYALCRNNIGLMDKEDGWNEIAVYALGPHIATYVNGKKSSECYNWTTLKGFVGVSAHDENTEAQFKDIEVKVIKW